MAELCNLHQDCTAFVNERSGFSYYINATFRIMHCVWGGGGGVVNVSSIGNYDFLYVKEPSIISSQFSLLYVCNLLEVYDGEKW